MDKFGTLDCSEKKNLKYVTMEKNVTSTQILETIGSRNGAPSRKQCVVNDQMTTAWNTTNEYAMHNMSTPPPSNRTDETR